MKIIETELCTYSLQACRLAQMYRLSRVELCSAHTEGGITPSAALIELAAQQLYECGSNVKLHVMIRPRGGDFVYDRDEMEQMRRDIRFARQCGADGVALGVLTPDGYVDVHRTAELAAEADGMAVTFHRAFDMTCDLDRALEDVVAAGCSRILTSGGRSSAYEAVEVLRGLAARAAGRIGIMAGSGVRPENARQLIAAGVDALHFSASMRNPSPMEYRRDGISMSSAAAASEYDRFDADPECVRAMAALCGLRE